MKRHRTLKLIVMATVWSVAVASTGLLAWGWARPAWYCRGGLAMGLNRGRVEVARSSGSIRRAPIAWDIQGPEGYASVLVGSVSGWRPSSSSAAIGISPSGAPAPLFTLTVVYVPLWPWALLSLGAAGGLSWRSMRQVAPGHCRACGYDLRGLGSERCPECGRSGTIAWIVAAIMRRSGERLPGGELLGLRPVAPYAEPPPC